MIVMGAYSDTFRVPFLFDDVPSILSNSTIRHFAQAWRPPSEYGVTVAGRPLVNVSLAINYAISGYSVWSYHLFNLLIHLATGIILFDGARRTLLRSYFSERFRTHAAALALSISALWLLHPLQTEAVTYTIQRAESLMAFFYLLTLWFFIRSVEPGESRGWKIGAFFACLAGMATKEVMVSAPLIIALYDRIFVAGSWADVWKLRRGFLLALSSTWILLIALVISTSGRGGTAGLGTIVTPLSYALTQAYAICHYLQLVLWPSPLVFDYGTSVISAWKEVALPGLAVLGFVVVSFLGMLKGKSWGFCGLFFFLVLAPTSSVVPVATQTIAEHRMYLPLAAVVTVLVVGAFAVIGRAALLVSAVAACALAVATYERNGDYRDLLTLWGDTATKRPSNVRALNNYALELQKAGRPQEANAEFLRAIAQDPGYVSAHSNYGAALLAQKRIPEAVDELQTAVQLAPAYADARVNLGNALVEAGRSKEAVAQFQAALELEPDAADVRYNLGLALELTGEREAAAEQFRAAVQGRPDLVDGHYRLARIADDAGRLDEAEEQYSAVLEKDPQYAAAQAGLGVLMARKGKMNTAEEHLRNSVRLRPTDPDTLSNLGNVLLLEGKTQEAIFEYEASLHLRPDDAGTQQNLQVAKETLATGPH